MLTLLYKDPTEFIAALMVDDDEIVEDVMGGCGFCAIQVVTKTDGVTTSVWVEAGYYIDDTLHALRWLMFTTHTSLPSAVMTAEEEANAVCVRISEAAKLNGVPVRRAHFLTK